MFSALKKVDRKVWGTSNHYFRPCRDESFVMNSMIDSAVYQGTSVQHAIPKVTALQRDLIKQVVLILKESSLMVES